MQNREVQNTGQEPKWVIRDLFFRAITASLPGTPIKKQAPKFLCGHSIKICKFRELLIMQKPYTNTGNGPEADFLV